MTKSRIKKSRRRAMLRGVDAMLDIIDEMLAPVRDSARDAAVIKSLSQPLELMWMPRLHRNFNPFE